MKKIELIEIEYEGTGVTFCPGGCGLKLESYPVKGTLVCHKCERAFVAEVIDDDQPRSTTMTTRKNELLAQYFASLTCLIDSFAAIAKRSADTNAQLLSVAEDMRASNRRFLQALRDCDAAEKHDDQRGSEEADADL